jgi:ATP phosphoribosyltransferase regulatory subunit
MVGDRPHLPGARLGAGLERLGAEVARVLAALGRGDAERVEPAALQPAEVLLDLYGEDIRARAFVTGDDGAEMMLRPDFTVPIAQLHMERGLEAGTYVYCGPVWRRQEAGSQRGREYLQAGVEIFGGGDPADADAEVLARVRDALCEAPVDLVTGDMGLPLAAIDALPTSEARKAALRRHLWRPKRFHALLLRFGEGHAAATAARTEALAALREGRVVETMAAAGAPVGLRAPEEVLDRLERLAAEAETPPLERAAVAGLEAVLAVAGPSVEALARLEGIARDMPGLRPAVARLAARLAALEARGIDPARLRFEGGFGRTTLEYYDGFVFGAEARGRPDLPPLASGGRYDALTRVLGGGRSLPAVGGIVRPEALLALMGAARCG